ncbi:hypothetical protein [Clostridium sp. DJ247]|uniref:hypothetical protein n=1 Tax=Clostridium sp. DJ247 TaxID=2726188 RepID=UPI0016266F1B|nr:hypothetical protein [Clostridium sp. DJ247]MBC2580031.1 hypothetical protein [Clostridium sp. DJ247]
MRKFLLIFLLLIMFITPISVKAADKSYTIDKLSITANITEKGDVNERLKWLAYRQYLLECFTNYKQDTSLLDIDEALIYASALEIEEIHSKAFSKKLSDLSYESTDSYSYAMYNNYSFFLMNLYMWDSISDSIYNNSIDNSNNNNNNGGGNDGGFGGFSGGGDFSGGGGGDSGAF